MPVHKLMQQDGLNSPDEKKVEGQLKYLPFGFSFYQKGEKENIEIFLGIEP